MAPLQKRALYQLVALAVLLGTAGLVLTLLNRDASFGLFILIAAAVACEWLPRHLTRPRPDQPIIMDERDQRIIANVMGYRRVGIILAVFVWFSVLFFRTDAHEQVIIGRLSLMLLLWSVLIADATFSVVGTLVEYWRVK